MSKKLIDFVKKHFADEVLSSHSRLGNDTVILKADRLPEVVQRLRDDDATQMNMLRAITCVDYLKRLPRFEVIYILYSIPKKHMLTLRVLVDEESCQVPTIEPLYGAAGWMEREVWDMYGVVFEGHSDLRRVLLYEEFEGHPLRKDYAKQQSQPRIDLLVRERDSVEEFNVFCKNKPSEGSRNR
jgi:NADH-quinone oxidoreductase subunit C